MDIVQVLLGFVGMGQRGVEYLACCGIWVVTRAGGAQGRQLGAIPAGLFGP